MTIKSLGNGEFEARWFEKNEGFKEATVEEYAVRVRGVELKGTLYLDVQSTDPIQGALTEAIAGRHLIFGAHLEGDRLFLGALDPKKVRALAAEDKLQFTGGKLGQVILDAPTAELQEFIVRHRDEIFGPATQSRRIARPQFD
jgi:hypothetical protein